MGTGPLHPLDGLGLPSDREAHLCGTAAVPGDPSTGEPESTGRPWLQPGDGVHQTSPPEGSSVLHECLSNTL